MSNNCCTPSIAQGGTLIDVELINSVLQNPSIVGGLTMDDITVAALITRICADLKSCVEGHVNNNTFDQVTLRDVTLNHAAIKGVVTIDDNARDNIANTIGPVLGRHIMDAIKANGLRDVEISNASLSGDISLTDGVKTLLHKALSELIKGQVDTLISDALTAWEITGNTFENISGSNMTATNTTLNGVTTLSGQVPLDTDAHDHLVQQLTESIKSIAEAVLTANRNGLASIFQDCTGAPHAAGTRIPTCQDLTNAISIAFSQIPALDVISGVSYDEKTHTLTITTTLNHDGGQQQWEVKLDSLGGQVVTDGTTISGTGVTGDPIKLVITETVDIQPVTEGTSLPTAIHGNRVALLGQPDKWINIGGYLIPAFNRP